MASPLLVTAVHIVVASLDDHGLLTATSRPEMQLIANCSPSDMDLALDAVKKAGPAGVASFSVQECLLAKIDDVAGEVQSGTTNWTLARCLVEDCIDLLAADRLTDAAERLRVSSADVVSAIDLLRNSLTPYPYLDLGQSNAPSAPPSDVILTLGDSGVTAEIVDPWSDAIGLDADFVLAADLRGPATKEWTQKQIGRARLLLAALDHRRSVLERVVGAIVAHHEEELIAGSTGYSELHRRDIANILAVHESTVSRAVKNRTARLPQGRVIPLEDMFGSGHDVRIILSNLIAEGQANSDQQLSEILGARGISISRRTVAKYRRQIGAASSSRRRPRIPVA